MSNRSMSRRRFVELAAGAGAISALSALVGCAPKTIDEMEANQKASKTIDCDVLVIGAGAAGITAAEQAREAFRLAAAKLSVTTTFVTRTVR